MKMLTNQVPTVGAISSKQQQRIFIAICLIILFCYIFYSWHTLFETLLIFHFITAYSRRLSYSASICHVELYQQYHFLFIAYGSLSSQRLYAILSWKIHHDFITIKSVLCKCPEQKCSEQISLWILPRHWIEQAVDKNTGFRC